MVVKTSLKTVIAALVLLIVGTWWLDHALTSEGPLDAPTTAVFASNTHFTDIADILASQRVIAHPLLFKLYAFVRGESSRFKAGEYAFPAHIPAIDVVYMIANGKTLLHRLTIPEGLMTSEILELVKLTTLLDGEITLDIKEGELLPETYSYSRGDKRNDILTRMRHAMQKTLAEAWEGRADGLPFTTPVQALTLASIVEKETGLTSERPRVAAVYINRLRQGMLLQADPTTAYAVTQGKFKLPRPLTYNDLKIESPYNTYFAPGLPPGPIANPGKASILATLHPIQSDELYFVATGTGGHNFARTPKEHEENVRKFREHQH